MNNVIDSFVFICYGCIPFPRYIIYKYLFFEFSRHFSCSVKYAFLFYRENSENKTAAKITLYTVLHFYDTTFPIFL